MSKVYSFRLDTDNLREAQAMNAIDAWVSQGYSLRHILTDALINYQDIRYSGNGWEMVYDQLTELVRGLENGVLEREPDKENSGLSPQFVDAMMNSAKMGLTKNNL